GAVAARQQRAVDRARNGGAEGGDVGAEVGEGLDMEREETPVNIEREFRMGEVIAGLIVRDEAFRSARGPAYGPAQASRRPGDDPLLRIGFALVAEAAAHVRRDDAQRALGNAELLGDLATDVMRSLRGGVERELFALRLRQHRARFDR